MRPHRVLLLAREANPAVPAELEAEIQYGVDARSVTQASTKDLGFLTDAAEPRRSSLQVSHSDDTPLPVLAMGRLHSRLSTW